MAKTLKHYGKPEQAMKLAELVQKGETRQLKQPIEARSFDNTQETIIGVIHSTDYDILLALKGAKTFGDCYDVHAFPEAIIGEVIKQLETA